MSLRKKDPLEIKKMQSIKNFLSKHWGKLILAVVFLGILFVGSCGTLVVGGGALTGLAYWLSGDAAEATTTPVADAGDMPETCEASVANVRLTLAKDNSDGTYDVGMPASFADCYVGHKAGRLTAWDASTGTLVTCDAPLPATEKGVVSVSNCAPAKAPPTTAKSGGGAPQPAPSE